MSEKSWRNCELVVYEENLERVAFWETLENVQRVEKYAWILHDKDEGRVVHAHFELKFRTPLKTGTICKAFGVRENQIESIKGTWADALDYLTHGNAPEKYQYDSSEVHANFDWESVAKNSSRNGKNIDEVLVRITQGDIGQYNVTDYVTGEEYIRYDKKIKAAFQYRLMYVKQHLEEIVEMKNIVWVYGKTGTGKTTFAKQLSKSFGFFYRLTSTGVHMFDEYTDEPCLIIDDLRPEDIKFSDLLGILDPYNFRAAQARYNNKALQTKLLIVTSIYSPEEFATRCIGDGAGEDERQLFRRIDSIYEFTESEMWQYEFRDDLSGREDVGRYPNMFRVIDISKRRKEKKAAMTEKALEMFLNAN